MKFIKLGDYIEALIYVITFGFGNRIATLIAKWLGFQSCGCCERKEWLNKLTNKDYNGNCKQIKLW